MSKLLGFMVIILSNEEISDLVTMEECLEVLEAAYIEQSHGRAINQLRYDTRMPVSREEGPCKYQFKTMVGILPKFDISALRMSSTIHRTVVREGGARHESIAAAPGGRTVGIVQLYSISTGEPLAFFPDSYVSGLRLGGTYGLATKYLARKDAEVVGLLGAGWQAGFQLRSHALVRKLKLVKVYSPTKENRERFAKTLGEELGVEVVAVDSPNRVKEEVDILLAATNAVPNLIFPDDLHPGMHVGSIKIGELDNRCYPEFDLRVVNNSKHFTTFEGGERGQYGKSFLYPTQDTRIDVFPVLEDIMTDPEKCRTTAEQITLFEGSGLGLQFAAVGAKVYENAMKRGVGKQVPTEWLTQEPRS
ncbi:MAG: ornithine cyclodeaminase family protein [Nitrososphaerales archaeon]